MRNDLAIYELAVLKLESASHWHHVGIYVTVVPPASGLSH